MTKVKVLCITAFYLPGNKAGGPVQTISSMVQHLANVVEFDIFTSDRDIQDQESYPDIVSNAWKKVGDAKVFYISPGVLSALKFIKILRNNTYDILYVNSFFSFTFGILPVLAKKLKLIPDIKLILAPRGEFSAGALKIKKIKKAIFIIISKLFGLHKNIIWHASSQYEVEDIKRVMNPIDHSYKIIVAPDLTHLKMENEWKREKTNLMTMTPLKVCFISRISPKKNLDYAISVLAKLKCSVVFDIYGPIEDTKYWRLCEAMISKIENNILISYKGILEHDQVGNVFQQYNLFFFPTKGENFGHVIIESMVAGTPVLLSDATPWRNLESKGVGWDIALENTEKFVETIETLARLDLYEYLLFRERVKNYGVARSFDPSVIELNKNLFISTAGCTQTKD